jgi:hypothetical protein
MSCLTQLTLFKPRSMDKDASRIRSPIDDIDPRIVKRVWRYRFGHEEVCWKDKKKLSKIVHSRS